MINQAFSDYLANYVEDSVAYYVWQEIRGVHPQLNPSTIIRPYSGMDITLRSVKSTSDLQMKWVDKRGAKARVFRSLGELIGNEQIMKRGRVSVPVIDKAQDITLQMKPYGVQLGGTWLYFYIAYHADRDTLYINVAGS